MGDLTYSFSILLTHALILHLGTKRAVAHSFNAMQDYVSGFNDDTVLPFAVVLQHYFVKVCER